MYEQDVCIVGAGTSDAFGYDLGKSPLRLQMEAFTNALGDAGLDKSQIDGFVTAFGSPRGVDYEEFVVSAGLDCRWVHQMQNHGRWTTTNVALAALVISAGLANYVLLANTFLGTRNGYGRYLGPLGSGGAKEGLRDVGGGHGEWDIHGVETPGTGTAFGAQRYMEKYGASAADMGAIAVAFREHASRNPMAILRSEPLTIESYLKEPVVAGPFRRPDFCLTSEGSVCLIVTSRERARDLRQKPVVIAGFDGVKASRDDSILFSRPGLGVGIGREFPYKPAKPQVYAMARVEQRDIAGLYMYDAYSSGLWMVLERFGFCDEGGAPAYVRDVGIGLRSQMPVNTNGGLLSEAHMSGYGHLIEMVRQLRGQAEGRQLPNPRALQWVVPWGDSLVFTVE